MGTNFSHQEKLKLAQASYPINNSSPFIKDDFSSYHGVKSDFLSDETKQDSMNNNEGSKSPLNINKKYDKDNPSSSLSNLVPYTFTWEGEAENVYVSGSFNNWADRVKMKKFENNEFSISLFVPKGVLQFKFIVDGVWKFSKNLLTCNDGKGNTNNIVDLSGSTFGENLASREQAKTVTETSSRKLTETMKSPKRKSSFTDSFPSKNEMDSDCKYLPRNYNYRFSLDDFTKGRVKKFSKLNIENNEVVYKPSNVSYSQITKVPHVNLNHLFTKLNIMKKQDDMLITSYVHKLRNKFITVQYYKQANN